MVELIQLTEMHEHNPVYINPNLISHIVPGAEGANYSMIKMAFDGDGSRVYVLESIEEILGLSAGGNQQETRDTQTREKGITKNDITVVGVDLPTVTEMKSIIDMSTHYPMKMNAGFWWLKDGRPSVAGISDGCWRPIDECQPTTAAMIKPLIRFTMNTEEKEKQPEKGAMLPFKLAGSNWYFIGPDLEGYGMLICQDYIRDDDGEFKSLPFRMFCDGMKNPSQDDINEWNNTARDYEWSDVKTELQLWTKNSGLISDTPQA